MWVDPCGVTLLSGGECTCLARLRIDILCVQSTLPDAKTTFPSIPPYLHLIYRIYTLQWLLLWWSQRNEAFQITSSYQTPPTNWLERHEVHHHHDMCFTVPYTTHPSNTSTYDSITLITWLSCTKMQSNTYLILFLTNSNLRKLRLYSPTLTTNVLLSHKITVTYWKLGNKPSTNPHP